jgi:hypothetical protein
MQVFMPCVTEGKITKKKFHFILYILKVFWGEKSKNVCLCVKHRWHDGVVIVDDSNHNALPCNTISAEQQL